MLVELQIQNYALIKALTFKPNQHLNTITGETGAGKSIMLGALGLILGKRADSNALFDQNEKCIIEGVFKINDYKLESFFEENDLDYESETRIRREINTSGKSRAFINDTPTTLDVLKELGEHLIDIHSQHDTQFLKKSNIQLSLIDAFANSLHELNEYKTAFQSYSSKNKEFAKLKESAKSAQADYDYNNHLFEELSKLDPIDGEEESLEKEMEFIDNIELIKTNLFAAQNIFNNEETGAESIVHNGSALIKEIHSLAPQYAQLFERIQNLQIELKDITSEIESENESLEYDETSAEKIKTRYDLLQRLLKKHFFTTAAELIQLKEELAVKVNNVSSLDEQLITLEKEVKEALTLSLEKGGILSKKRKSHFSPLSDEIQGLVEGLGMPESTFVVNHTTVAPTESGIDDINFLFSANKGRTPVELKNSASGGEMSRLMFAIKHILADKVALPTVIFDEIDTGISGEVALQMGEMMKKMAQNHQIITITHLPQIAVKGQTHFFVYKEDNAIQTESNIRELNKDERVQEIAQMIGGKNPSANAFESARELLLGS